MWGIVLTNIPRPTAEFNDIALLDHLSIGPGLIFYLFYSSYRF